MIIIIIINIRIFQSVTDLACLGRREVLKFLAEKQNFFLRKPLTACQLILKCHKHCSANSADSNFSYSKAFIVVNKVLSSLMFSVGLITQLLTEVSFIH